MGSISEDHEKYGLSGIQEINWMSVGGCDLGWRWLCFVVGELIRGRRNKVGSSGLSQKVYFLREWNFSWVFSSKLCMFLKKISEFYKLDILRNYPQMRPCCIIHKQKEWCYTYIIMKNKNITHKNNNTKSTKTNN